MPDQNPNGGQIILNIKVSVDNLNRIITELSKPIDPIVNLIADIRDQAIEQLKVIHNTPAENGAAE